MCLLQYINYSTNAVYLCLCLYILKMIIRRKFHLIFNFYFTYFLQFFTLPLLSKSFVSFFIITFSLFLFLFIFICFLFLLLLLLLSLLLLLQLLSLFLLNHYYFYYHFFCHYCCCCCYYYYCYHYYY